MSKTWSLHEFWEHFYDPQILERFDLLKEWTWVKKTGTEPLWIALRNRYPALSEEKATTLAGVLQQISQSNSETGRAEVSLIEANLLGILDDYLMRGDLSIIDRISEFFDRENLREAPVVMPRKALIEVTNNCNLNCVMCGVGAVPYDPARTMPLDFFRKICRTVLSRMDVLRLNGLGESTIIPNFEAYLKVVEDSPSELELVTNLSTPRKEILQKLLDLDFVLFISCDAVEPAMLRAIRRNLDDKQFRTNLEYVSAYSEQLHRDPLRTQIIMTILESNFRQLPAMVEFAAHYGVGGVIANMVKGGSGLWKLRNYNQLVEVFREANDIAKRYALLLTVPNQIEGRVISEDFTAETNLNTCPTYLNEIFVRYNGDVCPCNMMNPYVYGNLRSQSLEEILQGAPRRFFDHLMSTQSRHPYCLNCYYLRRGRSA